MKETQTETVSRSRVKQDLGAKSILIHVLDGVDRGLTACVRKRTVRLGSSEACDVRLSDSTVSREHLSVEIASDGLRVVDLGSKNGTYYLGVKIREATIPLGSFLLLGDSKVAFQANDPEQQQELSDQLSYGRLTGASLPMRSLYRILERVEAVDYPVLICGETGSGKELVAREIVARSARKSRPFEVCDCASFAPHLAESELFGHVKGAFTGADRNHQGVFERANGGSVFLDELGELPLDVQPKLLRVLENSTIRPVGGEKQIKVNVRVLAATHRDLDEAVEKGRFREDLYFRLGVIHVPVPPLRERCEDIPDLVKSLLRELGQENFKLSESTVRLMTTGYDWPGNVRELRNAVAQAITLGALPARLASNASKMPQRFLRSNPGPFKEEKKRVVNAFERDYFASQLERAENNISKAARNSGMERNFFKRLLRKHGLLDPEGKS